MRAPSGLRRSVIVATFTAMALLVTMVWLLETASSTGRPWQGSARC